MPVCIPQPYPEFNKKKLKKNNVVKGCDHAFVECIWTVCHTLTQYHYYMIYTRVALIGMVGGELSK